MQDGLKILVPDLGNPYRNLLRNYLSTEFVANLGDRCSVLEAVTAAIIASNNVRYGPVPSPESLVAIRKVITTSIDKGAPIPVLVPWGSKKPSNTGIDTAELGGLKSLSCLQKRVSAYYTPGLRVNLRVEDVGGYYLFADEGQTARAASEKYVADFSTLIHVLDLGFINIKLESEMMNEAEYAKVAETIRPVLLRYMEETDLYGMERFTQLDSWKELAELGWTGSIPMEQRDFYRERYAGIYPGQSKRDYTNKLATYLAGSLARYRLHGTGAEEWGRDFIQLNFAPPAPGTPAAIGDRRVYYRTLPASVAKTHIPPWRARGYVKVQGDAAALKLASWSEQLYLQECSVNFARGRETVSVQADMLLVG